MNIFKNMVIVTLFGIMSTGCVQVGSRNDSFAERPSLGSATNRGAQFGPSADIAVGSIMSINACGNTGAPVIVANPTIVSSAELRDHNGRITYDYNVSGSKVHKCVK